jgi:hypothetical protein
MLCDVKNEGGWHLGVFNFIFINFILIDFLNEVIFLKIYF